MADSSSSFVAIKARHEFLGERPFLPSPGPKNTSKFLMLHELGNGTSFALKGELRPLSRTLGLR